MMTRDITTLFPQSGEKTISSRLKSRGIRVQRRVCDSLHTIYPSGVRARCRNVLHRRQYFAWYMIEHPERGPGRAGA